MGRTYSCWMLKCWCITWPVGFRRLTKTTFTEHVRSVASEVKYVVERKGGIRSTIMPSCYALISYRGGNYAEMKWRGQWMNDYCRNSFSNFVVCLTRGSYPLPKRTLHSVLSNFNKTAPTLVSYKYRQVFLRQQFSINNCSCLYLKVIMSVASWLKTQMIFI